MGSKALAYVLLAVLLSFSAAASPQSYSPSSLQLLHAIRQQPTLLARYVYLQDRMPSLSAADQRLAGQFLSFSQDELGLYTQAVLSFPLQARLPRDLTLPDTAHWVAKDAVTAITRRARGRHIVMINEAHHNAHTRELTLALLPHLRALGFKYFAAEALTDNDPGLMQRGYPTIASGTEYMREPVYGDIVREAIRLGFTIVPYDFDSGLGQARENAQAENLYRAVFAKDPQARLVVHAGYAHIDKAPGRLGQIKPMAMQLRARTGFDPLSIDQTEFLETGWNSADAYHRLIGAFPTDVPEVFVNRSSGTTWSDRPQLYDMNVVLPRALDMRAFNEYHRTIRVDDGTRFSFTAPARDQLFRPNWLTLGGQRRPFDISSRVCREHIPCVVEARHADEVTDAIPADRFAFMRANSSTRLYLRPGRYRLRAVDVNDKTLSTRPIRIAQH